MGEGFNGLIFGIEISGSAFFPATSKEVDDFCTLFTFGVEAEVLDCAVTTVCDVLSADRGGWAESLGVKMTNVINAIRIAPENLFIVSFLSYLILFIRDKKSIFKSI